MRHSKKSFVNRLNLISQLCRQFKDKPASSFRPHSECTWKSSYKKTASAFCTLLGASVLAAILVLKPSGAQGLTLSKAVKISTFDPFAGCTADNKPAGTFYPNTETEPWIAVNPTNAQNLVAGWQQDRWLNPQNPADSRGARGLVTGVSSDGGATWNNIVIPGIYLCTGDGTNRGGVDVGVTFSPNGAAYFMTMGFEPNAIIVSRSTDGGTTWDKPITLIQGASRNQNDKPAIAADPIAIDPTNPNFVYAVWDRSVGSGHTVTMFSRTSDGGMTWEIPKVIFDPGSGINFPNQLVVLPNGTLINFFRNKNKIVSIRSLDKGATFSTTPVVVSTQSPRSVLTPNKQSQVRDGNVVYDVAVNQQNGQVCTVWKDARSGINSILFSCSLDGGITWSSPIKVNQTPNNANPRRAQAFTPSVEIGPSGPVVTYYDFRKDTSNGKESADYWAAYCTDLDCTIAGNWREVRLTTASFDILQAPLAEGGLFLGDYMGLTRSGSIFYHAFVVVDGSKLTSVMVRQIQF